jgi:hypothetical protein
VLRASAAGSALHAAAARAYLADAAARAQQNARTALAALEVPAEDVMRVPSVNTVALRRTLAAAAVERRAYPF